MLIDRYCMCVVAFFYAVVIDVVGELGVLVE